MNQKPASGFENEFYKTQKLLFKHIPHQSSLFLDFQNDSEKIRKFYPEKLTNIKNFAARVFEEYKTDRNLLCDALKQTNESVGAGDKTFANIELLREADCAAVVTGQQAGIFTGAVYTIYKIISAIKFAEKLKNQNVKAVPIFWVAEEDHDFEEVKKTFLLDKEGKLAAAENTPQSYKENVPVGAVQLDETIEQTINAVFETLPRTEFSIETKKLLLETYSSGETYSAAFARLIAKLFEECGLIILLPLNAELKNLSAPFFAEAIEKSDEIIAALAERNRELEADNYSAQVLVAEDSFPFFLLDENNERRALRKNLETGKFKIQNSKIEFEKSELLEIARRLPQKLSPNALLRPVAQDYLLPTIRYFGGAAEIAYFAQNSAVYKTLNRPATPIRHRASFTIIEPKFARTLAKYKLNFADLFSGKEKLSAEIVEKFLSCETAQVFTEVEEAISAQINRLDQHLLTDEPTLSANLANRRKKILWHIGALRRKYHRAEILKNETFHRRIETLFAALLPHGALQERTLNIVNFLNLYGENFVRWVYEAAETDEGEHQILFL